MSDEDDTLNIDLFGMTTTPEDHEEPTGHWPDLRPVRGEDGEVIPVYFHNPHGEIITQLPNGDTVSVTDLYHARAPAPIGTEVTPRNAEEYQRAVDMAIRDAEAERERLAQLQTEREERERQMIEERELIWQLGRAELARRRAQEKADADGDRSERRPRGIHIRRRDA